MIICPICNTSNHHLRVICTSCGGFVQHRVDNLNLFQTIWKIFESPRRAFRTIAIAQHKNYSIFLGALSGYAYVACIFWLIHAADFAGQLIQLLIAGLFVSPFIGLVIFFLHLLFTRIVIRAFGYATKFRNLMGVVAYTLFPLIFAAIFVLPVELITFGVYLFMKSPNPFTLLPFSAYFLFGLDVLLLLWFFILHVISIKELLDIRVAKSLLISVVSLGITVITIGGILSFFIKL